MKISVFFFCQVENCTFKCYFRQINEIFCWLDENFRLKQIHFFSSRQTQPCPNSFLFWANEGCLRLETYTYCNVINNNKCFTSWKTRYCRSIQMSDFMLYRQKWMIFVGNILGLNLFNWHWFSKNIFCECNFFAVEKSHHKWPKM